jgi:uncharacterized protein YaiL (DUF2058 family)
MATKTAAVSVVFQPDLLTALETAVAKATAAVDCAYEAVCASQAALIAGLRASAAHALSTEGLPENESHTTEVAEKVLHAYTAAEAAKDAANETKAAALAAQDQVSPQKRVLATSSVFKARFCDFSEI